MRKKEESSTCLEWEEGTSRDGEEIERTRRLKRKSNKDEKNERKNKYKERKRESCLSLHLLFSKQKGRLQNSTFWSSIRQTGPMALSLHYKVHHMSKGKVEIIWLVVHLLAILLASVFCPVAGTLACIEGRWFFSGRVKTKVANLAVATQYSHAKYPRLLVVAYNQLAFRLNFVFLRGNSSS